MFKVRSKTVLNRFDIRSKYSVPAYFNMIHIQFTKPEQ